MVNLQKVLCSDGIKAHRNPQIFLNFALQLMTLPALQDACIPAPGFLRVWQLEGSRLARILKGKQATLRYCNFFCRFFLSDKSYDDYEDF